jgi:hypothetical protein
MGYEANSFNPSPSELVRFLEDKNVWLFICFVLFADIAVSFFLGIPLSALRIDDLDRTLPIGAAVIFICLFAILVLLSWKIRLYFYYLTARIVHRVERTKSADEYRNLYRDLKSHSVSNYTLYEYAIEHDHQVLHNIYSRHVQLSIKRSWTLVLEFISGALLSVHPFLPTSSIHVHVFSRLGISDWWILIVAVSLMIYGTHSDTKYSHYVHVGSQTAALINKNT